MTAVLNVPACFPIRPSQYLVAARTSIRGVRPEKESYRSWVSGSVSLLPAYLLQFRPNGQKTDMFRASEQHMDGKIGIFGRFAVQDTMHNTNHSRFISTSKCKIKLRCQVQTTDKKGTRQNTRQSKLNAEAQRRGSTAAKLKCRAAGRGLGMGAPVLRPVPLGRPRGIETVNRVRHLTLKGQL